MTLETGQVRNKAAIIAAATAANDPEDKWGRYIVAEGHDLHSAGELGEDYDLFWEHLEGLTGEQYDDDHRRGLGWSCTC